MKILVTGANGQLGFHVCQVLNQRNIKHLGVDIKDFDITDKMATEKFIKNYMPDAVIHCSAYTAVDRAEDEADLCYKVNAQGTKNIASVCQDINAKMIYISTDYVFDGTKATPYEVDDKPAPISVYGKTKLQGELFVKQFLQKYFIVRTAWVFGENGNNFVKTMLALGKQYDEINVVADQMGSPTYTVDLAVLLCDMVLTNKYGTYHATNEGYCSWADFAKEIFKVAGLNIKVNCITTDQYPTKAVRPKNSRLSKDSLDKAGFERLQTWESAVERHMKKYG